MKMSEHEQSIQASDEAWEERQLGADESFVEVVRDDGFNEAVDRAARTKLISIRMELEMIDALKYLASKHHGIGYQTLIKQILARFIDAEMKNMWNEEVSKALRKHEQDKEEESSNDRAA